LRTVNLTRAPNHTRHQLNFRIVTIPKPYTAISTRLHSYRPATRHAGPHTSVIEICDATRARQANLSAVFHHFLLKH
jgi:hypothetical protein